MNSRNKRRSYTSQNIVLGICLILLASFAFAADETKTITVNVDPGTSEENNVGCGFTLVEKNNTDLVVKLTSSGTIEESKLVSCATGQNWTKTTETEWKLTGVAPNEEFWCVIKAKVTYEGGDGDEGGDDPWRWMSVSDVDLDGDTDNDSGSDHRPPSESDAEDLKEYPTGESDNTIGLVMPLNDNNDVCWHVRDCVKGLDRSSDGDILDMLLKINPKRSGRAEFTPGVWCYDSSGNTTTDPEFDDDVSRGSYWPKNLHVESGPDQPSGNSYYIGVSFDPDEPEGGRWSTDKVRCLLVGTDIDVDSDNSGGASSIEGSNNLTEGEDFYEIHPASELTYHPEFANGMIVPMNNDSDDGDSDPDNGWNGIDWSGSEASIIVTGEDDLRPLIIRDLGLSQSQWSAIEEIGTDPVVEISRVSGDGVVRLFTSGASPSVFWHNSSSGSQTSLPDGQSLWDALKDKDNGDLTLQVEGLAPGEVIIDILLRTNGSTGPVIHHDTVRMTVAGVRLTPCNSNWMPKGGTEDNETAFTAKIYPSTITATIKFTLYWVSSRPGYCLNRPAAIPASGEDSDMWMDLQFKDNQNGLTISGINNDIATTDNAVNSANVSVTSFDYAASGKLKAEAQINGTWIPAFVDQGDSGTLDPTCARIPYDLDENEIADCWEYNSGNASDDLDSSLNNSYDGDGLSRIEEYRGVDFDGDGKVTGAERLNPNRKDLFVQGSNFGGWVPFAYGASFHEAQIDVHAFAGTPGMDDRNIDVMVVTVLNAGGHLSQRGVRDWIPDTLGQSSVGNASSYGVPQINRLANDYLFSDKPYRDGMTWSAQATWGFLPNGMLDPLGKVEDCNDNGVLEANEDDGSGNWPPDDADGNLSGDHAVPDGFFWDWDQDLSPEDKDNDGLVDAIGDSFFQATKPQVVKGTITHEMGHAAGIADHCTDPSCEMYEYSNTWHSQGHFCNSCRAKLHIHNK